MADVIQKFTGDPNGVIRAYDAILRHTKKMEDALGKITAKTKEAESEQEKLAKSAERFANSILTPQEKHAAAIKKINQFKEAGLISDAQQLRGYRQADDLLRQQVGSQSEVMRMSIATAKSIGSAIAGYVGLNAGVSLYVKSLEKAEQLEKKMKDLTVTEGDAAAGMFRNLGTSDPAKMKEFDTELRKVNAQYHPVGGMKSLYQEASSGLSASQTNIPMTLDAIRTAAEFAPDSPEDRMQLVGASIDISKATGSKDALSNLGLIKRIQEQSRITDIGKIAKTAPGVLIALKEGYGDSPGDAAALFAATTQASGDTEGERSATSIISLASQLSEHFPEKDRYQETLGPNGRMQKKLVARGTGMKSTMERLQYLQTHPKDQERIIPNLSIEKRSEGAIFSLVKGKGAAFEALKTAQVPLNEPISSMATDARKQIDAVRQVGSIAAGNMDRANESVDSSLLMNKEKTLGGLFSRETMQKKLEESGMSYWDVGVRGLDYQFESGDNQQKFTTIIQRRIDQLRASKSDSPGLIDNNPNDVARTQMADSLQEFVNQQKEMAKVLTDEIKLMRQTLEKQSNRASPAGSNGYCSRPA